MPIGMASQLACTLVLSCFMMPVSSAGADEPTDEIDGLEFREPFTSLSAEEIESKLLVFLITDDDPFLWTKSKLQQPDKNRLAGGADLWCGREFRTAFEKLFVKRADLKHRCLAQRLAAGAPSRLLGGQPQPLPKRAVVAICDGQYRLLNFTVGVPDADDLVRLIEDAEETKMILTLHNEDPAKIGDVVLQRTQDRVRRIYRESLDRLHDRFAWDESLYTIDEPWIRKHAELVRELRPAFLYDSKLRFGLSDASDLIRLLILDQHVETRQDWCESIAPFIVGRPIRDIMNPLLDTTWGMPVVLDLEPSRHEELLRWFSTHRENSMIILSILPNQLDRETQWPPHDISGRNVSGRDWHALELTMSDHPFRTVTIEQLAFIMREHDERPINLFAPSRARYVFFEPKKKRTWAIRETDLPGKFIQRFETD